MTTIGSIQQAPIRNSSVIGAQVYSHSGEYSPQVYDLTVPGRGVSLQFIRKYRSANHKEMGLLGRGWTFSYARRIEQDGTGIVYHDGYVRAYKFTSSPVVDNFSTPNGLYGILMRQDDHFLFKQRYGTVFTFENPDSGGRLLAIEDRNGNALRFEYQESFIVITDAFGHLVKLELQQDRIVALRDHAGREWRYGYDDNGCLIEVIQPSIAGVADNPRVQYRYDQELRLVSITDPNGQTFLQNTYDDQGRIIQQQHGIGIYKFDYHIIQTASNDFPVYQTKVQLKNGALLSLTHDEVGHVVERTIFVSTTSLSPEDRNGVADGTVPITTNWKYNRHGESVARTLPAGNATEWAYDEENPDPRAQGNLLRVTQRSATGIESDQSELVSYFTYEPDFQRLASATDPRGCRTTFEYDGFGNLTKKIFPPVTIHQVTKGPGGPMTTQSQLAESMEYNPVGQLTRFLNTNGIKTDYFYYPASDPAGSRDPASSSSLTQAAGGYLAKIAQDTTGGDAQGKQITTGFAYDDFGNVTLAIDGKGNVTRLEYNAHNQLISTTARDPFTYKTTFDYDANGNLVEETLSFDHHDYDPMQQDVAFATSTVRQVFEYNALNNVVRRKVVSGEREITRSYIRDANENVIRQIQPMGNVKEYRYDERGRLIAIIAGPGTREEALARNTYTRNGKLRSTTDGLGNTTLHQYDGFHRYKGFSNAAGTVKKQQLDEIGNVTYVQVTGDAGQPDQPDPVHPEPLGLLESWFQYDELGRLARKDRAWKDSLTGQALGKSQWDDREGFISSVVQYGDNLLPARLWVESGNILSLRYDGANRITAASDETGESVSVDYDENSNATRLERLGPQVDENGTQFRQVITQEFDELDRLTVIRMNEDAPHRFVYNSLGFLTEYKNPAGSTTRILQDPFGRSKGSIRMASQTILEEPSEQAILNRAQWNDNDRISAWINPSGNATRYQYDALNRLSGVILPDGASNQFDRDANGNITRMIDPNLTVISNRFDALNRLVERSVEGLNAGSRQVETYRYDGLNRLVAAQVESAITLRRYDSLSRLLSETQSGREIRYEYDSAGNRVILRYPGGEKITKSYDVLGRVVEVRGKAGSIATYTYATGTQFGEQQLGDILKVSFTYDPGKDRLSSILYLSTATGEIVDGYRYQYDVAGNCIQEVQLRLGEDFGERYFYDSANRLVKVQYGVERLADPQSLFEQEVTYQLSPTGIWKVKTTRDKNGQVAKQAQGTVNLLEAYRSLGSCRFDYDANGNRIQENGAGGAGSPTRYRYDYANRLVRAESLRQDGQITQTIEFGYDAFNRQAMKRITKDGETHEYVRVWNGSQLIEEWEDGQLLKTFAYGIGAGDPLKTSLNSQDGLEEFYYSQNGSGSVTGLADQQAKVIEAYHYDVYGQPFLLKEHGLGNSQSTVPLTVKNSLFTWSQLYDLNSGMSVRGSETYDSKTNKSVNRSFSDPNIPWSPAPVVTEPPSQVPGEGEGSTGGYTAVVEGIAGMSKAIPQAGPVADDYGIWLVYNGIVVVGVGYAIFRATPLKFLGSGYFAGLARGAIRSVIAGGLNNIGRRGSNDSPDGDGHPGGGSTGGSGRGSSDDSGGHSGAPGDRGFWGNGVDHGHPGGDGDEGSRDKGGGGDEGSRDKGGDEKPEDQKSEKADIEIDNEGQWHDNRPGHEGESGGPNNPMPNPEDPNGGGREGIDKNWWRTLPNRDATDALKKGLTADENILTIPFQEMGDFHAPEMIKVEPGGEFVTIDLSGVHSQSMSFGSSTSDGWGDKPRSLAEAVLAPRARSAITSRF